MERRKGCRCSDGRGLRSSQTRRGKKRALRISWWEGRGRRRWSKESWCESPFEGGRARLGTRCARRRVDAVRVGRRRNPTRWAQRSRGRNVGRRRRGISRRATRSSGAQSQSWPYSFRRKRSIRTIRRVHSVGNRIPVTGGRRRRSRSRRAHDAGNRISDNGATRPTSTGTSHAFRWRRGSIGP